MKSLLISFAFFLAFLNILPLVNGSYYNTWNCCSGTTCVANGCSQTVSLASQCITDQCTVGTCRPECGAACSPPQTQPCTVGEHPGTQTCQSNCQWGSCPVCGVDRPGFVGGTFNITAYIEYLNVFWDSVYPNHDQLAVNCTFYGKSIQQCVPYPYFQPPGKGSCTVPNPQYDYANPNEMKCRVYDPNDPSVDYCEY